MRIFYLTSEFLWPPHHGGRVRSLAQLRLLASLPEVGEVVMLGLTEVPISAAEVQAAEAALPKVRVLPPIPHPIHLIGHLREQRRALARVAALRVLRRLPYLAGKWDSPTIHDALERILGAGGFDVVYIDHLGMARYADRVRRLCPRARLVIEAHNVESDFFRQFAEQRSGPARWAGLAEWRATQRFERQVLRGADAVVAISQDDARALALQTGAVPLCVPQVVDFQRRQGAAPADPPQLCYVGNLTWHPNVRGLDWFCEAVWPLIHATMPQARLRIAGSGLPTGPDGRPVAPPRWQAPGIEVHGFLPELEPLYAESSAMIAPIFGGSGVRIKLLEALRAGMPTVTTPEGAAGLLLTAGQEVLIESDEGRFAAAALELLRDGELRDRLREAGYRFLERHHTLGAAQAEMRKVLGVASRAVS